MDENKALYHENHHKGQHEISSNLLIQQILKIKKGISCTKCGRPYKVFIENISQIEQEIVYMLEENDSLKFILNQFPQGFCKIDKKSKKVSICNYQMLNRTNIIDKESLYKILNDLRIQIANIISQTETANTNQNNPLQQSQTKINQKINSRNNNEKLNEYISQHKALSTNTFQKKNNLFPFLQFNLNNNLLQNNQLITNNKQNQSQASQLEQQIHITNNQYDDDNASVNQNNIQNNINAFHLTQYSQLEDVNTKRISDVSKKSGKYTQVKLSANQSNMFHINNQGNLTQNAQTSSNQENIVKISGFQDDNNLHLQQQQQQQQQQQSFQQDNQYQIHLMKQNFIQNNDKQFPSSDVCSFNFSNFEASPMQNNRYSHPLERDLTQNIIQLQKINVRQSDFNSSQKTKQLNTSQNDQAIIERTEDGLLQTSYPIQIIGKQISQTNNSNNPNFNEFDSSNFNLLEQKVTLNKNPTQENQYKAQIQAPDFTPQSSQQTQQIFQNNKSNNREFFNKESSDFSKLDRFQTKYNSMQVNAKPNQFNLNQINAKRMSIRQEVNRKRVLTDNVLTQIRRDSQFMNYYRNEKKDINTTNSYNLNFNQNNYNSNSLAGQLNNLIDQDIQNLNILTLDEVMNVPILQYNMSYSLKLSESFGDFTSVKLIKQSDQSFYLIFDDFEDKLVIEQELLKELESFQTKVLKSISHEFGTPLNCAINMLKMCSLKVEKELNSNYILPALSSIRILKFSCSDFIDYAKIQFNCFKLDIRKTDLRHLLKKVVEYFQPLMESQKQGKERIQLIFLEDSQVPEYIMSDPSRIMQVIFNLLTNALKFTQKGFIKIKATCISEDEIEISVQDSGIGIQVEQQDNLFERKTIKNKKQETSGLGLIISNALAQRLSYQGQGLNLQSKVGEGSLFSFNININCQSEKNKKQDLNRRYTTQKNQSNSEQNSISDFTQSIFPYQLNHASNTQIQNIQLFNQQSLMTPPPKIIISNSSNKLNKSLEIVDKIVELNKSQEQLSKNFSMIQNNQYEIQQRSPISQKIDFSSSEISDEGLNINEFVKDQKQIVLPPSFNLSPNKKAQQQEDSEDDGIVLFKDEEKINQNESQNKKSFEGFNNASVVDDLLQSKQNPKNFYFSAKFIQNIDKGLKYDCNRKMSIDLCDEMKKIYDKYDNQEVRVTSKKHSFEKNFHSLHHLNSQYSNIQLASNTSINCNKQGTNTLSKQIIETQEPNSDTLEIIHYELTQKDKQGSPKNQSNFNTQTNDDQYLTQDSIITQVVSNQQSKDSKEGDKFSEGQMDQIIVINDQKICGGILQYNKKVSSPVQKKKQLTFSAKNQINNYGNLYDLALENSNAGTSKEKIQNFEINNQGNYNKINSLKYIQHSQKQIISPIKIINQKISTNDLNSIKLINQYDASCLQNHQNNYLIQQQKPIFIEDSKSSEALMNPHQRFITGSGEDNQNRSHQLTNQSQQIQELDGSIFIGDSDQKYITPQLAPSVSPNTQEYDFLQLNNQDLNNSSFFLREKLKNQNMIQNSEISSQDHEIHKNQELQACFDNPHSFRATSELCIQPFQNKLIQQNQPYSHSYHRGSELLSSQKIIPTHFAKFKKPSYIQKPINNGQPVKKHYSERLIPINDFQYQLQNKFMKSKQNILSVQSNQVNQESLELSTPLRMKCYTLQEQFSNPYQNSQQDEIQGQIHQQIKRKVARKRTKSEFAVQNNIQEIKVALKNKLCNCPDILIVDDTQMNRHTLRLMIQSKLPFIIDEATNGQEAVDKVEQLINTQNHCLTYKMIFMDIDMPKMNGYEATYKINELFKKNDIFCPIIAHTAFDRSEVQEEMNQCNMIDYAGKPISTAIIEQLFARYIDVASITGEN
ncbi:ATPase, histidine kinase-, DNA gyrase B (macronuclear) [Tetrahymena thermophila SB210]|uniref:ATPase, histidine kinase-, DNA gyrase B n=1 Tax=Tetrahymena thermophila (strain SB210) TaxID=312017 RepID=Q24I32_TETTS|nr:ATPase, histidine kinase-, DNA gyrase B [Tetrahymena thermophila SB210]EAS07406.2 ATPase, histidine kinase-, DNA gyrase B [Tetrahymena thermophila SB210]|eukprot:XP_001027648.2 ATPase, histidine kinase-, DNA gyrase B [Tetrahymena thermophila SB210]